MEEKKRNAITRLKDEEGKWIDPTSKRVPTVHFFFQEALTEFLSVSTLSHMYHTETWA